MMIQRSTKMNDPSALLVLAVVYIAKRVAVRHSLMYTVAVSSVN